MIRCATILCLGSILWSGCSSSSFVGRRVDNFTAYYNTFYNARKAYTSGFNSIERKDEPIDLNRYLPLFVRPSGNTANRQFEDAVVKSADILRDHQESKWVDDALLLIGKSYFYQENIVGALQKFQEVIDRQTDLEDEARFWLARTLIVSRSYDEAQTFLQESLAREGIPAKWMASYRLALGEGFVQRSDWQAAADALSTGLREAKDKKLAARAQFLLGQVYENMDRPALALEAYRNVKRFNPLFELGFAANLSAVRIEGLYLDATRALKALRKLERDDKYFLYRDELRFMRGRILQGQRLADDAYNAYFDLLYDSNRLTPMDAELRGRIHYAMGELYRDLDRDFMKAAAHFDSASVSLTNTSNTRNNRAAAQQFTRAAIVDAVELKDSFRRYSGVYSGISNMDSLLWLGTMDQEAFDAKILELRLERARLLEATRKAREARLLEQRFRMAADSRDPFLTRGLPEGKIIPTKADPTGTQSGFLFHRDPERVDDGRNSFLLVWGDRPLVPNWRRIDAVRGAPAEELLSSEEAAVSFDPDDPTTLPEIDISAVPRDSLAIVEMSRKRAVAWLDLGNALFLSLNMPDSAAVWYRKVIEENPDDLVVQRAYYALAEVQKTLGDRESTDRLYDQILNEYPESEYSRRIREQRGEVVQETEIDSSALALAYYEVVSEEWSNGQADDLINQVVLIAVTFPGTEAAAKSLLAGGEYHLESAGADRSKVLAPLQLQLPEQLLMQLWPDKWDIKPEIAPNNPAGRRQSSDPSTTLDSLAAGRTPVEKTSSDSALAVPAGGDSTLVLSVEADSVAFGVVEDDSVAQVVVEADSTAPLSTEPEKKRPEIYVEDLFSLILNEYGQSPYASRAMALRTAVDEIRNPAPDPKVLANEAAANLNPRAPRAQVRDSLRLGHMAEFVGSLAVSSQPVVFDSLGFSRITESVLVDAAPILQSAADSLLSQLAAASSDVTQDTSTFVVAAPARQINNTEEPFANLAERTDRVIPPSGVAEADSLEIGRSEIDDPQIPVKVKTDEPPPVPPIVEEEEAPWVMLYKYPEIKLDNSDFDPEFEMYLESSTLKPLRVRRLLDTAVVGWTVLLERASGLLEARSKAGQYSKLMDTETQKVMILKDVDPSIEELIVTWGIFSSKTATDRAVAELSVELPGRKFYILMTPAEPE